MIKAAVSCSRSWRSARSCAFNPINESTRQCCSVVGNRSLTAQSPVKRARTSIVSPARAERSSQRCRVDAEGWTLFSDFDSNFAVGSLGQ